MRMRQFRQSLIEDVSPAANANANQNSNSNSNSNKKPPALPEPTKQRFAGITATTRTGGEQTGSEKPSPTATPECFTRRKDARL